MPIAQQLYVLTGKDGLVNTHRQLQNIKEFIMLKGLITLWFKTNCSQLLSTKSRDKVHYPLWTNWYVTTQLNAQSYLVIWYKDRTVPPCEHGSICYVRSMKLTCSRSPSTTLSTNTAVQSLCPPPISLWTPVWEEAWVCSTLGHDLKTALVVRFETELLPTVSCFEGMVPSWRR